jgi:hypothetical protein
VLLAPDIRTREACEQLVAGAVEGLGGLEILVNNAAYQQSKADISEISDEQFVCTSRPMASPCSGSARPRPAHAAQLGDHQHGLGQLVRPRARSCLTTPAPRGRSSSSPRA